MSLYLLILYSLFCQFTPYELNTNNNINQELFLLGFMEDFEGCYFERNFDKRKFLITIHEDDVQIINSIKEVTGLEFSRNKRKSNCRNCHEFLKLEIKNKKWKLKRFYNFRKEKTRLLEPSRYCGSFKEELIKSWNTNDKISYLKGISLRNMRIDSSLINISFSNAHNKYNITKEIMKELGFMLTNDVIEWKTIPVSHLLEYEYDQTLWEKYIGFEKKH